MYILGINAYHADASAALVKNGCVVAAAEEERFTREKHWAGLPLQSIQYCLEYSGLEWSSLSHIAINSNKSTHFWKKLLFLLRTTPNPKLVLEKIRTRSRRENVKSAIESALGESPSAATLHSIEHHHAHLASAFYPSQQESSVLLSIDGFGDFSSAAWGRGEGAEIVVDGYVHFPHSMGVFYQSITQYLGFPNYGDEYKVMGLASYGKPLYIEAMRKIVDYSGDQLFLLNPEYFKHHRESSAYQWEGGTPVFANLYSSVLEDLLGPRRQPNQIVSQDHKNIAASAQLLYEEVLFRLLNHLYEKYNMPRLAMAGGCAMNSVANGKIISNTPFKKVYVQPASGDAGGAIGAALVVSNALSVDPVEPVMPHAYLGPGYNQVDIDHLLIENTESLADENLQIATLSDADLLVSTATALAGGAVVGWFQGRMEWGARALGNRSILADPRRVDIQKLLNEKIKRRESFRPFAPSILREHVKSWFVIDDDVPFMEKVYPIAKQKQSIIPGVTHIDGTGRLQTVSRDMNSKYYDLISEFYKLSGVPLLLNTSFNENEPIVCTPQQALDCFLRTKMDILVLENTSISRVANS